MRKDAFTLVELLVVIGVIAVLTGILLPVTSRARESGRIVNCQSNLRQLAIAVLNYREANSDWYPATYVSATPVRRWMDLLKPHVVDYRVYDCPSSDHIKCPYDPDITLAYGMNTFNFDGTQTCFWYAVKETRVLSPSRVILMADSSGGSYYVGGGTTYRGDPVASVAYRHSGGFCAAFCDTHTDHLTRTAKRDWSVTQRE